MISPVNNPIKLRTFQCWTNVLPDCQTAAPVELSQGQLHIKQRETTKDQHDAVRNEEGPAAILVANVREAPDITQINCESDDGQQELRLLTPVLSRRILHHTDLHLPILRLFYMHFFRL